MKPAAALVGKEWDKRKQAEESGKAQVISLKLGGVICPRDFFKLFLRENNLRETFKCTSKKH